MKINSVIALILTLSLALSMTGCATEAQALDLMADITPQQISGTGTVSTLSDFASPEAALTDFAVRLFQQSSEAESNTLVSPLSVLYALAMTANGAKGETLAQMEAVLGMSLADLNEYLFGYNSILTAADDCKLQLANSIWFNNHSRFTVNRDFLQTNANYYGADIYSAPFDESTLQDINNWVKAKTEDRIPRILDDIPESAIMYLINALAFEGEWSQVYTENQIRQGTFTNADSVQQDAEFMYSEETKYLETENATGFFKYYKGGDFAFVALLPNEDATVEDLVSTLDGSTLNRLLSDPQIATVRAAIPKFETEYSADLASALNAMGIADAFDPYLADLSGLGTSEDGNISISRVLHKTYLLLDAQGTKAGAATVIEATDGAAYVPEDIKTVHLDRPFVYMLIDCNTNIPFFIGTVNDLS